MSAWPFLFARGYVIDYQLLVCLRLFADQNTVAAFRRAVSSLVGKATNGPAERKLDDPLLADNTLIYLSKPATSKGTMVTDVNSRPIWVVYGFVFDDVEYDNEQFKVRAESMLETETSALQTKFDSFWRSSSAVECEKSDPIDKLTTPRIPILPVPSLSRPTTQETARGAPRVPYATIIIAVAFILSISLNIVSWLGSSVASLGKENERLNVENGALKKENDLLIKENRQLQNCYN